MRPSANTDRELYREGAPSIGRFASDYYAPNVYITAEGNIGMSADGRGRVASIRQWMSDVTWVDDPPLPTAHNNSHKGGPGCPGCVQLTQEVAPPGHWYEVNIKEYMEGMRDKYKYLAAKERENSELEGLKEQLRLTRLQVLLNKQRAERGGRMLYRVESVIQQLHRAVPTPIKYWGYMKCAACQTKWPCLTWTETGEILK